MKKLIMLLPISMIIGCSDKNTNLQDKKVSYQRFLSEKNLNQLKKDLNNYDEK